MFGMPGMRSDEVRLTVASGVKMSFDLLLLCTNHTHRDWHDGESLQHGCHCTAAAALLLYCCVHTDVVAARLSGCF